jgi:DnaK suppressor protein
MNGTSSTTPKASWALTRLKGERWLILDHLAGLRGAFQNMVDASAGSNADDEHDPEGSTIAFERSQLNALIHQAERHLDDIEDARMRVASGRYGLCETCGQAISHERLGARPVARSCIVCAAITRWAPHSRVQIQLAVISGIVVRFDDSLGCHDKALVPRLDGLAGGSLHERLDAADS